MTNKVLAIIPARGDSKGFPKKNIALLNGLPLIAWTIQASLKSKYICKTLVTSDSEEILDISNHYGAEVLKRPDEYATDSSSSEDVVRHTLSSLKQEFDYIILLQPTSPLRNAEDIDAAFELFFGSKATSLISVCEVDNKLYKAFKEDANGYLSGISNNQYPFMRRQDLPKAFMSNGAIYIVEVDSFLKNNSFYSNKTVSYQMPEERSVDIDSKEDLDRIESQKI
ncbi:acylneuraminate cytidylyltransferase [bacterium]|nr:acylneuraminate cytidylyltransferase [bacterium]